MQISTTNLSENLLTLKLDGISYFAFFTIINGTQLISYKYKFINDFYYPDNFTNAEIITSIETLTNSNIKFFNQKVQAEIQITKSSLSNICKKLLKENVSELTNIAKELGFDNDLDNKEEDFISTEPFRSFNSLTILDIDKSFKNKILFYYLFSQSTATREDLTEKAELITMEKQEEIFQNILKTDISALLPEVICKHPFCTIEATLPYLELIELQHLLQTTFFIQPINTNNGIKAPETIINTDKHELFLSTIENTKKINSKYYIAFNFKQNAIFSINLKQYEVLIKSKSTIIEEIITLIKNNFNFLK